MASIIHVPAHLKGHVYWGSKKIELDNITLDDARLILKESPSYGIMIVEPTTVSKIKKSRN